MRTEKKDAELRKMLEAEIKEIGGLRKWASAKDIHPSLVCRAMYQNERFPPSVAEAVGKGYVAKDTKDLPRWILKPTKKK